MLSSYLPAYEDVIECSETSVYKIQTHENYPEVSIQPSEHGEILKSRTLFSILRLQTEKSIIHTEELVQ